MERITHRLCRPFSSPAKWLRGLLVLPFLAGSFTTPAGGAVLEKEDRVIYRNFDGERGPTKADRHHREQEELAREMLKNLFIGVDLLPRKTPEGEKRPHRRP